MTIIDKRSANDWCDLSEENGRLVKIQKDARVINLEYTRDDGTTYELSFEVSDKKSDDDYEELRKFIGYSVTLILEDAIVISWKRSDRP